MLLARAARPLARARALSSTTPTFTLHAFTDANDFGFGRGAQFCMLNLRHDALFAKGDPAALYAAKYAARRAKPSASSTARRARSAIIAASCALFRTHASWSNRSSMSRLYLVSTPLP